MPDIWPLAKAAKQPAKQVVRAMTMTNHLRNGVLDMAVCTFQATGHRRSPRATRARRLDALRKASAPTPAVSTKNAGLALRESGLRELVENRGREPRTQVVERPPVPHRDRLLADPQEHR